MTQMVSKPLVSVKAVVALGLALLLAVGGAVSYLWAMEAKENKFSIAELEEPTVLVEWHDYVAEQDGTTVITRSKGWPPVMDCTITKGSDTLKLNLYNANFTAADAAPWAWISSEYSDEYIKKALEGTMLLIKANGVDNFPGTSLPAEAHVVEAVKDTSTAPITSGSKTFYYWKLKLGWLTTEVPVSALENIAAHQPYEPGREGLDFTG